MPVIILLGVATAWLVPSRLWVGVIEPSTRSAAPVAASPESIRHRLQGFLEAPTWAGKRAFVLDAARLDLVGAAYYDGRDADLVKAADFHPWSLPGSEGRSEMIVLKAERSGRRPVLAIFRQSGGGWYLDWEMFCQTYDEAFPSFLAQPSYPLRTLRGRMRRTFTDPGSPNVFGVELSDPLDPGQRVVFALPPGTPIMQNVAEGLTSTAPREATVEVCWARPDPEGEWVPVLQRLVGWGWRDGAIVPAKAGPGLTAPQNFLLPTQAPRHSPPPDTEQTLADAEQAPVSS